MKKLWLLVFLALLAGCLPAQGRSTPAHLPTPTATPSPTSLPTPLAPGDSILWLSMRVELQQVEITGSYVNEFGSVRIPQKDQQFLWVRVALQNTGQDNLDLPGSEHFSALYAGKEFKPGYGHRRGYVEYTSLGATLFPAQFVDAWLRFDIPATAELKDIRVAFLPESSKVGVSASSPSYPWGGQQPVYIWYCER